MTTESGDRSRSREATAAPSPEDPDDRLPVEEIDRDAAARGALYAILSRGFTHPDEEFHDAASDGHLDDEVRTLVETASLDVSVPTLATDDDYETLCARYNDLFVIGYATYEDRTDGSLASEGPPVPLYESAYRPEASWNDVNLDLARAYDYYGLGVDQDDRDNHDALTLQLEFAGYLARREAAGDDGAAAARLDLVDRHLSYVADGVADRIAEEPGAGLYDALAALLERLVAADQADLAERRAGGELDLDAPETVPEDDEDASPGEGEAIEDADGGPPR